MKTLCFPAFRTIIFSMTGFLAGLMLSMYCGTLLITPVFGDGVLAQILAAGLFIGGCSGAMLGLAEDSRKHTRRLAAAGMIGAGLGYLALSLFDTWMDGMTGSITYGWPVLLRGWLRPALLGIFLSAAVGTAAGGIKLGAKITAWTALASIPAALVFSPVFLVQGLNNPNWYFLSDLVQALWVWVVCGWILARQGPIPAPGRQSDSSTSGGGVKDTLRWKRMDRIDRIFQD